MVFLNILRYIRMLNYYSPIKIIIIMRKEKKIINVLAISNCGTTVQITMTKEVDDLTGLINKVIGKIKQFEKEDEKFKIVHIDSVRVQKIPEL